jgi:hypothetical protein
MVNVAPYTIDPDDPRAPSPEVWQGMTPEEQRWVVDRLPSEVPWELNPPDGDHHYESKEEPRQTLRRYFRKIGRQVYLSCDLNVYYPKEARFAPDLLAVLGVEDRKRMKWVVADEGKGLDFVLEVHVAGDREKDFDLNVARYARLGIPEYFIFEPLTALLRGYALPDPEARTYQLLVPQHGRWPSRILDLELAVEGERLRFYYADAPLPATEELVHRLQTTVDEMIIKRQTEQLEAERLIKQERERAERKIAELQAELERLRRGES